MQQIGALLAVFLCGGVVYAEVQTGGMLQELRGRGLDVGGGLSVHLDSIEAPANASIFERHALRFDFNGAGVRFRVDGEDDAFKVGLYYGDGRAYRRKEISEMIVPALLGYKTSALVIISLFGVGVMVFKALMIAKMAVVVAAVFWMKKFFGGGGFGGKMDGGGAGKYNYESSHVHPVYAEYPGDISELGYAQTASGNYIAYAAPQEETSGMVPVVEGHDAVASSQHYSYAEAPKTSAVATTAGGLAANATSERRRAVKPLSKPQKLHSYITVKRKSARH